MADFSTLEQEILELIANTAQLQQTFQTKFDEWDALIQNKLAAIDTEFQQVLMNLDNVMNRTFYVDQINGDDNNPGTADAPLKTLNRAVELTPTGGFSKINVIGDYLIAGETEFVIIEGKTIKIILQGTLRIKPWIYKDNYYKAVGFLLKDATLYMYISSANNGKIILEDIPENLTASPLLGLVTVNSYDSYGFSHLVIHNTSDNYTPIYVGKKQRIFGVYQWSGNRLASMGFSLSGHYGGTGREIIVHSEGYVADLDYAPGLLYVRYDGGFKNENGTAVNPTTKITGIIRDVNGNPRNVISNLIL